MESLEFNTAMLVSGIILAVTFIGIFTETLHGMERSKFAALGAAAMIVCRRFRREITPMRQPDQSRDRAEMPGASRFHSSIWASASVPRCRVISRST